MTTLSSRSAGKYMVALLLTVFVIPITALAQKTPAPATKPAATPAPKPAAAPTPKPAPTPSPAPAAAQGTIVLDTSSYWRSFATIAPPVVRENAAVKKIDTRAAWLNQPTSAPAADWTSGDFNDGNWCRMPGMPFTGETQTSPFISILCMRGRFEVTDPSAVKDLKISVTYNGGIVVYINGRELTRQNLPKDAKLAADTPANDYADGEPKDRKLENLPIPSEMLQKGTNILAIEVRRAAFKSGEAKGKDKLFIAGNCLVTNIRLTSLAGRGLVANVARPKGLQVWNSDILLPDADLDRGDQNEKLQPIKIIGARNGSFSGKVVVGSSDAIKGLRAVASDLTATKGEGKIQASNIVVRYGVSTFNLTCMQLRYLAAPGFFDAMDEEPPAEIPVKTKRTASPKDWNPNLNSPGVTPSFGAVAPIFVTVSVPADATAGDYAGQLTINAGSAAPVVVPISLKVCNWKLPDPHDFRTFADVVESPESVAMQYNVPLWSDKHFQLMEKSLKLLGNVGTKVVYLPLICKTNMGNEETMVRWTPQPDGSYKYDFTIAEKYLDLFEKCAGKPTFVCLYVSDYNTNSGAVEVVPGTDTRAPGGPANEFVPVTGVDAAGAASMIRLPKYSDPKSKALWKPVMDGLRERLKARGLEKAAILGISSDFRASEATVNLFKEISPGTPWMSACHPFLKDIHKVPCEYTAGVWGSKGANEGGQVRYGWQRPDMSVLFPRSVRMDFESMTFRGMGEINIAGDQRGFARLGGDFWKALKNKKGEAVATISARFPDTGWRNLDIATTMLEPGKNGAISTSRYEMLREGMQECEARIYIEKALTDKALRAKIGEQRAARYQNMLNERTRYLRIGMSTLLVFDVYWTGSADIDNTWWQTSPVYGTQWYVASGWQDRSEQLYSAAAEIAQTLGQ